MTSHKNSPDSFVRKIARKLGLQSDLFVERIEYQASQGGYQMKPNCTNYWGPLIERARKELPDDTLEPKDFKKFLGGPSNSELAKWLKDIEVLSYHIFPDGNIDLNFTGREFKNWLSDQETEHSERYL